MKDKNKKLSEDQIRLLIREALIREFQQARTGQSFRWQVCNKIDIPDGFIENQTGKDYVKKAEKTAAFAAQIYGVPGFMCNIFNSLFGDNPEQSYKKEVSNAKSQSTTKTLAFDLYTDEFEHLKSNSSKFIKTMADNVGSPATSHVEYCDADYRDKVNAIKDSTALSSDPTAVVKEINNILAIRDRGTLKKVKALKKEVSVDNGEIISQAVSSSLVMLRAITHQNLGGSSIKSAYGSMPTYERFVRLTEP